MVTGYPLVVYVSIANSASQATMSNLDEHPTSNLPGPAYDQTERQQPRPSTDAAPRAVQRSLPLIRSPARNASSPFPPQLTSPERRVKMPIPRLRRNTDGPPTSEASGMLDAKNRVSHACEPCRHRKTKCSGERPVCRHCQDFKIECNYADGKRDRTKRYVCEHIVLHWKTANRR